jgi:23S rRNA pseudouridine1911/1915/1917 synthase
MTNEEKPEATEESYLVGSNENGTRIDLFLNQTLDWNSRSRIKEAVKLGTIIVNNEKVKPSYKVKEGDQILVHSEPPPPEDYLLPEDIPLDIIHEDASILVVNKQAFIPVHPGAGHRTGTLSNALAFHFQQLSDVAGPLRPGIVHRLDRDTTGALCVAKTNRAHYSISSQFHDCEVSKNYTAIAEGVMEFDEYVVDEPIGRHPKNPIKMAVVERGRASYTRFEIVERFNNFTLVRCFPRTGRTHQIRVHLEKLGHPIACDRLYGHRHRISYGDIASLGPDDPANRKLMDRQALHATTLGFSHPLTGEQVSFDAPLAPDMQAFLDALYETKRGTSEGRDSKKR